jgi:D-2-hydroxyacid dehydrogenase (NADP+)
MYYLYSILFQILHRIYRNKWKGCSLNILVYETKPQRIEVIKEAFEKIHNQSQQVLLVKSKLSFLALSKDAHIIYAYGLSKYLDFSNLKLLYLGQVGNSLKDINLPFRIVTAPNFVSAYMADYTLAAVLAYEKKLLQNAFLHNNIKWIQENYLYPTNRFFNQLKIGILGLGKTGCEVANVFLRINCAVFGYDTDQRKYSNSDSRLRKAEWPDMLSFIDYLIITVNDTNNTGLIDKSIFSRMNPGLCIVNISRASVINESAFIEALRKKMIRGAILDVFQNEPLNRNSKFNAFHNVVITPHIAGNIDLVFNLIVEDFIKELNRL